MHILLSWPWIWPYNIFGTSAAILIIIEGQLHVFQRFSISKLVLKTIESCFVALNNCGNGIKLLSLLVSDCFICNIHHAHTHAHTNFISPSYTYTYTYTHFLFGLRCCVLLRFAQQLRVEKRISTVFKYQLTTRKPLVSLLKVREKRSLRSLKMDAFQNKLAGSSEARLEAVWPFFPP